MGDYQKGYSKLLQGHYASFKSLEIKKAPKADDDDENRRKMQVELEAMARSQNKSLKSTNTLPACFKKSQLFLTLNF